MPSSTISSHSPHVIFQEDTIFLDQPESHVTFLVSCLLFRPQLCCQNKSFIFRAFLKPFFQIFAGGDPSMIDSFQSFSPPFSSTPAKLSLSSPPNPCSSQSPHVFPNGPGAAPLRALRKLRQKTSSSRSNGLSGTRLATLGGKGSRAVGGRRFRFFNSFNVLLLSGAHPVDSKACRAADNSPIIAKFSALATWLSLFLASPLANSCRCSLTGNVVGQ